MQQDSGYREVTQKLPFQSITVDEALWGYPLINIVLASLEYQCATYMLPIDSSFAEWAHAITTAVQAQAMRPSSRSPRWAPGRCCCGPRSRRLHNSCLRTGGCPPTPGLLQGWGAVPGGTPRPAGRGPGGTGSRGQTRPGRWGSWA